MTWMNVINHSYCLPHLHLYQCIVVMYYVNMVNHKVAPYIATGTQDSNWVSTIARIWILRSKTLILFFIADSFLLSLMLFSSKLCPGHLKWILHSRFKYELVCFQKRNCRTKSGHVAVRGWSEQCDRDWEGSGGAVNETPAGWRPRGCLHSSDITQLCGRAQLTCGHLQPAVHGTAGRRNMR